MYFWNAYPFVRLVVFFIIGILINEQVSLISIRPVFLLATSCALIVGLLLSQRIGYFKLRHVNGLLALLVFVCIGFLSVDYKYKNLPIGHYSFFTEEVKGVSGIIVSTPNERKNHFRYNLSLDQILVKDSLIPSSGTIHLYIKKDSLKNPTLKYGDQLHVAGNIFEIPGPDNPNEFNYKKYTTCLGIYGHSFINQEDLMITGNCPPNLLLKFAFEVRAHASAIIDMHISTQRENGIAKALLIGIKDHIDNDIKLAYSSAGAMHVLAVSGLHVGIVYLLLQAIFFQLKKSASGRVALALVSVFLIWFYAMITGLSPSVLRAATMFSVVALSEIKSRKGNIYNTLGIAAFIMLLYDPYLIYSVGFQLSFAAVLGIVYFQPKIYRLIDCRFWLLDKAWAITCVSIAAQLSTFPLSAFYFNQFPTYFLVSNLVVIPAATGMLVGGLLMLLGHLLHEVVGSFFGSLLSKLIWTVNESVSLVERMPFSLIEWIYIDKLGLVLIYGIVLTCIWGLHHRSFRTLTLSCVLFACLLGSIVISHLNQSKHNYLLFYSIKSKTAIDYVHGHNATLFLDQYVQGEMELLSFQIDPYRRASHLEPIQKSIGILDKSQVGNGSLQLTQLADQQILIIDSTTFHLSIKKPIESDVIMIENGSVKSLKWLAEHFDFSYLLLGNKNSNYYCAKMKKEGLELGIPIHALPLDGAYKLELGK